MLLSDLGHNTDPVDPRNSSIKERKRMGFETWWKMQHILPAGNKPYPFQGQTGRGMSSNWGQPHKQWVWAQDSLHHDAG